MTLSADDNHWPELGMTLENLEFKSAFGRSFFDSLRKDPLLAAIHFERRFRSLMKNVILSESQPLGKVIDYFARVEFQNRGSPHIHMFLWVADVPKEIDNATAATALKYINSTICSNIPNETVDPELHALVNRLQIHHHTSYCCKKRSCRFGFPRQVSTNTKLLRNMQVQAKNKGRFYITARNFNSRFVNDYNGVILRHWRANMDLQYIQNAEGAAYYVCSYICKSEPDDLKNALGDLICNVLNANMSMPRNVRLMKIGLCVLKHRRMSSQEAAFRMGSLQLLHASREFMYLNTWPPNKRLKILRTASELADLPDNDTNVFQNNILDYYRDRPLALNEHSLLNFASWFRKVSKPQKVQGQICCPTYDVWFQKRKKFCVVRYTKFPFGSEDYYYSMLLLLFPHRSEADLLGNCESARISFEQKQIQFDKSINYQYFTLASEIENAVRRIRLCEQELAPADEDLLLETVTDNDDVPVTSIQLENPSEHTDDVPTYSDFVQDSSIISELHTLECCDMSVDEYYRKCCTLSKSQNNALTQIKCRLGTNDSSQPFHFFISGGAGTGKSFLLQLIVAHLQHFAKTSSKIAKTISMCFNNYC
ncbi:uncharacterized protein LOC132758214 [Ruditapes philippinarum]|uniref:uncharacterized protein LOC132758214 n=1 Tax=Ruditapes philippinarum TaxID=129788 RepID=UPI00295B01E9|nr:uncharacterized protein LOC132758214 [Ruditapes philippinarum]